IPNKQDTSSWNVPFEGAYVMQPTLGMKKWVISFDLTSLYPSIMRQWNLGVDTQAESVKSEDLQRIKDSNLVKSILKCGIGDHISEDLRTENICMAANGTFYSNENPSFMKELMEELFTERKRCKDLMLQAKRNKLELEEEIKKRGLSL
ncbi:MAG TPA: DNA polymerase domain-containing protein, partial [Rhabdochlamydiaceae bacterium]